VKESLWVESYLITHSRFNPLPHPEVRVGGPGPGENKTGVRKPITQISPRQGGGFLVSIKPEQGGPTPREKTEDSSALPKSTPDPTQKGMLVKQRLLEIVLS